MENRKGNGIFLGIVSVATLIVAIIGATFAYFSASTESNTNAVGLTAYEFNLSLSVRQVYLKGANAIVPLKPNEKVKTNDNKFLKYGTDGKLAVTETETEGINYLQYAVNGAEDICVDSNGLQVCAIYEVTVYNQAVNPLTLSGQLKTTKNVLADGVEAPDDVDYEGFNNLTYQELEYTLGEDGEPIFTLAKDSEGKVKDPVTIEATPGQLVNIGNIEVSGATMEGGKVKEQGVGVSYVLIYLNDSGDQSYEMGAEFEGQLIYNSGTEGENGLTGKFVVNSSEVEQNP